MKWNGIGDRLVRRLLEEQDTVFGCYYAAKLGNRGKVKQSGGGEETGQRHIGKDVYVTCQGTRGEFEDGSEEESIE